MKNIIRNIFGGFAAAAMMLGAASCSDDTLNIPEDNSSEDVTVTFTLAPEASSINTRSEENPLISDGSKVDILKYAVYNEKQELILDYYTESGDGHYEAGHGQTVVETGFPATLKLKLKRGQQYTIAFWAQNRNTKAYNTADLKKVEVVYSEITDDSDNSSDSGSSTPNNDELRDVFCRSVTFKAGDSGTLQQNVYLYRPLAQINVGTSGFDYEIVTRESPDKYTYSKIRINRVARYLDVVADRTYSSTTNPSDPYDSPQTAESFSVVDFGWAPIPAYVNSEVPDYPSYTRYDWEYEWNKNTSDNPFILNYDGNTIGDKSINSTLDKDYREIYGKEQFLQLHHEKNDGLGKNGWTLKGEGEEYYPYASYNKYNDHASETFKWLSMSYVLTASTEKKVDIINNIQVWLATDQNGTDSYKILDINHVPVQRNWRTNIVGNLLTEENNFEIKLDKDFAGEYNGWNNNGWDWSGPLANGVYYDAENDEIQISSKEGLLWFQRMVNGDLKIRVATEIPSTSDNYVGKNYWYYNSSNQRVQYNEEDSNGYIASDFNADIQKRILKATHQDKRTDHNNWPTNNNFHFTGATVKLMADIDLEGIEWLPIGMDYKVAEFIPNYVDTSGDPFKDSDLTNRGFYGTFDGNGHTIYNLKTRRFGASVDEYYIEQKAKPRNYDAFPWHARGFFGEIGGNAHIKNLRLVNVDIYGCHGVGGIAGMAYGQKIKIENCVVDGGTITATPMYRNDTESDRSFARGTYLGGIVGYFNTRDGELTGCEVKNVTIKGYRQVGSLIGTLDNSKYITDTSKNTMLGKDQNSKPAKISGNNVSNVVVIASQVHFPFGIAPRDKNYTTEVGFGWDSNAYDLYSGKYFGGYSDAEMASIESQYPTTGSNITFSKITETITNNVRYSDVRESPLENLPAFSSWFTDYINLYSNYAGSPSARKIHTLHDFAPKGNISSNSPGKSFKFPMNLPVEVEMDWDNTSSNVGLFVESVSIDGIKGLGGRSVITPVNVNKENSCAMFITARDRKNMGNIYSTNYKRATEVKNVVLRGEPYAWAGIIISPNENMSKVVLDNVHIYDVFQTIALNQEFGKDNQWPTELSQKPSGVDLEIKNSNWRGYTVPGAGWNSIKYSGMTFGAGASTGNGKKEHTLIIDQTKNGTTFENCYFKAPYIIELGKDATWGFNTTDKKSYATSTSVKNEPIDPSQKNGCTKIVISSDPQGNPIVKYYNSDNQEI